ncbi:calcium-binding protein [Roseomonas sp. AR75]|uniref:calcium-binding protein n=1 Tax=Roseomonas sp. AR75 TaxID=2562311 RepID=UPI0010C02F89|nr:M10 family metallopeptidase C-terminal domain-containing protein [Roseomonas sp. AR75]
MAATTPVSGQTSLVLSPEDGTSRFGAEYQPRIAGLPDGGFVALWNDFLPQTAAAAPAGYPYAIDADGGVTMMIRVFGADGVARGPARPVSADLVGNFDGAGLVTLGNGLVAAAWGVTDVPGGASRIGALVLDPATGQTVGAELGVATGALFSEGVTFHQIVALSGGRAGVIYVDGGGSPDRLRLQVLEADGSAGATTTLLTAGSTWVAGLGVRDTATALAGPNADIIAVAASTFSGFSQTPKVLFRNLDGSEALPEFLLDNPSGFQPVLAPRAEGGLLVAHALSIAPGNSVLRVYRLDETGAQEGTPTDVTFPHNDFGTQEVVELPDGDILLATSGFGTSGFDPNIYGQRINPDGTLDGGIIRMDFTTQGQQTRPEMAVTGDGSLVAAFEDTFNGFDYRILAARFQVQEPPALLLFGTARANTLEGGEGADTILGRAGDDVLSGGGGNDNLRGQGGNDRLLGEAGNDTLIEDEGADTLDGGEGGDLLFAGGGDDLLLGGAGTDTMLGGDGADSLLAGADADLLRAGADDDLLQGEDGQDSLLGEAGADTLDGGAGNDVLRGGSEGDLLRGGDGADLVLGEDGEDTLDGGLGADTLRGGAENDIFVFGPGDSAPDAPDLILDFVRGADRIDLTAFGGLDFIGTAAFTGGDGVAELRIERDLTLRKLRVEVDGADADAEADFVLLLNGLALPSESAFLA